MISITASSFSAKECALKKKKERNYWGGGKLSCETTKRRSLKQRPLVVPQPHVAAQFQNIYSFHRPFTVNMIRNPDQEKSFLSCYVPFCIPSFPFSPPVQVKSCDWGEKSGETQKEASVCPSWYWRSGSPPGKSSRTGGLRGTVNWEAWERHAWDFCRPDQGLKWVLERACARVCGYIMKRN